MYADITTIVQKILAEQCGVSSTDVKWERPVDPLHGDITTTVALPLAKALQKKPRDIAVIIQKALVACTDDIEKVEIAGPGYVNVWLTPKALIERLEHTRTACTPAVKRGGGPVIVDYSSPNIAKPLGIHHILSTIIGQAIVNLYDHAGFDVVRWNYLGDWGTQFGKLAVAFERWATKPASKHTLDELLELYVRFHEESEKDPSLEAAGQDAFRKLESGNPELRAFWSDIVSVTKAAMQVLYKRLSVSFDIDRGESYYEDKMQPIVEEGKKKKIFKQGEKSALIVEFPEETKLPPAVVMKGDGATLYLTRDLALMKDRYDNFNPQAILWAVDVAQQLYFQQLFATVKLLGWKEVQLEHMYFGRMRFADKAMSTRKGNILKLEEVLDEAVRRAEQIIEERGGAIQTDDPKDLAEMMGIGAIVYGILSQNRRMDIVFDWDKMLSFEGNSAPYVQYTHARARSVLRKAEMAATGTGTLDEGTCPYPVAVRGLTPFSQKERTLLQTLLLFPGVLDDARERHMPHVLAQFLFTLCQDFNAFYASEAIIKAEEPQRSLRLRLTSLTADVLATGAKLLTLRLPDRM